MKKRILLSIMALFLIGQNSYVSAWSLKGIFSDLKTSLVKSSTALAKSSTGKKALIFGAAGLAVAGLVCGAYFWNKKEKQEEDKQKDDNQKKNEQKESEKQKNKKEETEQQEEEINYDYYNIDKQQEKQKREELVCVKAVLSKLCKMKELITCFTYYDGKSAEKRQKLHNLINKIEKIETVKKNSAINEKIKELYNGLGESTNEYPFNFDVIKANFDSFKVLEKDTKKLTEKYANSEILKTISELINYISTSTNYIESIISETNKRDWCKNKKKYKNKKVDYSKELEFIADKEKKHLENINEILEYLFRFINKSGSGILCYCPSTLFSECTIGHYNNANKILAEQVCEHINKISKLLKNKAKKVNTKIKIEQKDIEELKKHREIEQKDIEELKKHREKINKMPQLIGLLPGKTEMRSLCYSIDTLIDSIKKDKVKKVYRNLVL